MSRVREYKDLYKCDYCEKQIPVTSRHRYKCKICKKDICSNHKIYISRRIKIRKYNYQTESLGIICVKCYEERLLRKKEVKHKIHYKRYNTPESVMLCGKKAYRYGGTAQYTTTVEKVFDGRPCKSCLKIKNRMY